MTSYRVLTLTLIQPASVHPNGCIGSHFNAILICFELPPLLPPILIKSLLTVLLQFVHRRPGPLKPRNLPVQVTECRWIFNLAIIYCV